LCPFAHRSRRISNSISRGRFADFLESRSWSGAPWPGSSPGQEFQGGSGTSRARSGSVWELRPPPGLAQEVPAGSGTGNSRGFLLLKLTVPESVAVLWNTCTRKSLVDHPSPFVPKPEARFLAPPCPLSCALRTRWQCRPLGNLVATNQGAGRERQASRESPDGARARPRHFGITCLLSFPCRLCL
jgi:hypothetical protein